MYDEIIRKKLIQARIEAGYTQMQIAELNNIPYSTIAKIESGHRRPDTETVGKLAEFYSVSTDWIFGIGKK